jgi:site-specific recombinase XerD
MNEAAAIMRTNDGWWLVCEDKDVEYRAKSYFERLRLRGLSENTCIAYGYDLVHFLRWLSRQKIHISTFSYQDLFSYIKFQTNADAKPRSINRRLISCQLFLKFLDEQNYPVDSSHFQFDRFNRAGGVRARRHRRGLSRARVKVPFELVEPLATNDINTLLSSAKCYRDVCLILLMALVGLRRCELLSISTSDIDLGTNTVLIKGKGRKERSMPIPTMLRSAIYSYLTLERPSELPHKKLFCLLQGARRGQPMSREGLRSLFRKRRVALNLKLANPHRLRHSFAYSMVKAGVPIAVLQRMMGHSQYQTTLRYVSLKAEDISEQFLKAMTTIEARYTKND